MATFLTLELVTAVAALVWGVIVLGPSSVFDASHYAAFDPQNEATWGLYFIALGTAGLFCTLTRSRRTRFLLDLTVCFSFAQLAWRMSAGDGTLIPAPFIYVLLGVLLPLVCMVWHFACMVIEDIDNVPEEVRRQWLDA